MLTDEQTQVPGLSRNLAVLSTLLYAIALCPVVFDPGSCRRKALPGTASQRQQSVTRPGVSPDVCDIVKADAELLNRIR